MLPIRYVKLLGITLLITSLLTGNVAKANSARSVVTSFKWERQIEIGEANIPIEVYIPISLIVDGLPDKAEPGDEFELSLEIENPGGSYVQVADKTFNIDDAIRQAAAKPFEIDLSSLGQLTTLLLTTLLEKQLKLPHEVAEPLAAAAEGRTKLTLSSDLNIDTTIKGAANTQPVSISTWFNDATPQTLKIDRTAREGEKIEVAYTIAWRLLLQIDLAEEVYSDPAAGPFMKQLAQLIGLPLSKELGNVQGSESLTHTVQVQVPIQLTLKMILMGIGIAIIIAVVVIIVVIKYPRKPDWR